MLAIEEPLEIRLAGRRFTVTMRTPGHDDELVAGFLFSEGFVRAANEIGEIRRVRGRAGKPEPNVIDVILHVPVEGVGMIKARVEGEFALRRGQKAYLTPDPTKIHRFDADGKTMS